MEGLVQIAYYFDSTTAQIERAKLESAGIPAQVFVEDLAKQGPAQGRLMVPASAVDEACEVLEIDRPGEESVQEIGQNWYVVIGIVLAIALAGIVSVMLRI
jgi:hypothetical protein